MIENRFSRTELLIGRAGVETLASSSVAIFGIGGVGSFAVEALCRAGIGRLILVDFDTVALSNLNRQVHALDTTVGRLKAEVMAERCALINPAAEIVVQPLRYRDDLSAALLAEPYDAVLDCIDLITAKLELIAACKERQLPIIASMGAANKLDPTLIRSGDLFATQNCRLARIMRKELRRRGVTSDVEVVYSLEEFRPLGSGRRQEDGEEGYQQRRAPLGSCSWIPSIFGLTMAGLAVRRILESAVSGGDGCG